MPRLVAPSSQVAASTCNALLLGLKDVSADRSNSALVLVDRYFISAVSAAPYDAKLITKVGDPKRKAPGGPGAGGSDAARRV